MCVVIVMLDHLDDLTGKPISCEIEDPRCLGFAAQSVLVDTCKQAEIW